MKKTVIFLALAVLFVAIASGSFGVKNECVRIHIRANSNDNVDQSVKYEVKDVLVDYLTPYLSHLESAKDAKNVVESKLTDIERIANQTLAKKGFNYVAKARFCTEKFPARAYGEYVLEEGVYDALIIELGKAEGKNWWCVLFPPLCFTPMGEGDTVVYKSKIAELCEEFFGT